MTRGTHYHPDHPHPDFPKSTRGAPFLSGLTQGEAHDTHKYNIRTTATAHPDDRHTLSGYVCPDHWLRKASLAGYHNSLPWPTSRHLQSERTRWSDNKSLPTITSHDRLPRSLSATCKVMMVLPPPSVIMTTQNISPPLKKSQSFWYYIYQPSHKEEGKLAIPSKRATNLSLSDHG